MSFYYPTSHRIEQGGRILLVTLLYDLFDGLTIGRSEHRSCKFVSKRFIVPIQEE